MGLSRAAGGTRAVWVVAAEVVWEEMEAVEETIRRQGDLVATIRRLRLTIHLPQTRHQLRWLLNRKACFSLLQEFWVQRVRFAVGSGRQFRSLQSF